MMPLGFTAYLGGGRHSDHHDAEDRTEGESHQGH